MLGPEESELEEMYAEEESAIENDEILSELDPEEKKKIIDDAINRRLEEMNK